MDDEIMKTPLGEAEEKAEEAIDSVAEEAEEAVAEGAEEAFADAAAEADAEAAEAEDAAADAVDAVDAVVGTAEEKLTADVLDYEKTAEAEEDGDAADEAAGEAESASEDAFAFPVIQELDEIDEDGEDDDEGDADSESDEDDDAPVKAKKPKKKTQLSRGCSVFLVIVLALVAVVGGCVGFFAGKVVKLSKVCPDGATGAIEFYFTSYLENMQTAKQAAKTVPADADAENEKYGEAVKAYESVISACSAITDSEGKQSDYITRQYKAKAVAGKAALTYKVEGYKQAYAVISQNLSQDEYKYLKGGEIKGLLATVADVNDAACKLPATLINAGRGADPDELTSSFDVDKSIAEEFVKGAGYLISGYDAESDAKGISGVTAAIADYKQSVETLSAIGADRKAYSEALAKALYGDDRVYSAMSIAGAAGVEGVVDVAGLGDKAGSVFAAALDAAKSGKSGADIFADKDIPDGEKALLGMVADSLVEGVKAEEDRNLTAAANCYEDAADVLNELEIKDAKLYVRMLSVLFRMGDMSRVQTLNETFMTDDIADLLEGEDKALYDDVSDAVAALTSSGEVFSSYYQNYYYNGELDFDACVEELDALLTDDSTPYDVTFVNYCKYYAAYYSGADADKIPFIEAMRTSTPDLVFVYGSLYINEYTAKGMWTDAAEMADKMLEINRADDFALSVKAQASRMRKDYEAAAEIAKSGVDLNGDEASNCVKELAIDCMLLGDYNRAYGYVMTNYHLNSTYYIDAYDLVLILDYLYTDAEGDIAEELDAAVEEIGQTFEYYASSGYNVDHYDDTKAILAGEKTFERVMTTGTGRLENNET